MKGCVIALIQELEYVDFIQEIPRIHIITNNLSGCRHPGVSVKSCPGAGIPVVSSVCQRFIGRDTVGMYQISSKHSLVLNNRIPVQPGLHSSESPVRILGMDLAQPGLIGFRKSLRGKLGLKAGIMAVGHRKLHIGA